MVRLSHDRAGEATRVRAPRGFTPEQLDRTVLAIPLIDAAGRAGEAKPEPTRARPEKWDLVLDLDLEYVDRPQAGARGGEEDHRAGDRGSTARTRGPGRRRGEGAPSQYVFARLERRRDPRRRRQQRGAHRAIFRIWPDFEISALITGPISTVKADAARASFSALGRGHRLGGRRLGHRRRASRTSRPTRTSTLDAAARATWTSPAAASSRCVDEFGHGTHVAGIIAGELTADDGASTIRAVTRHRDEDGDDHATTRCSCRRISGMAPRCKLLSLKVLDDNGNGEASNLIAAHRVRSRSQRLRPAPAHPRRQHERRLRVRAGVVRLRPEPALRRGRPAGALRRGRGRRRRQHRLRLRAATVRGARVAPGWT